MKNRPQIQPHSGENEIFFRNTFGPHTLYRPAQHGYTYYWDFEGYYESSEVRLGLQAWAAKGVRTSLGKIVFKLELDIARAEHRRVFGDEGSI